METLEATNNFVLIIRDKTPSEVAGLQIPDNGQEKPFKGVIATVGELVQDKRIQAGKSALWHKGNGWDMEYEGETYLVIEGDRIIAVV